MISMRVGNVTKDNIDRDFERVLRMSTAKLNGENSRYESDLNDEVERYGCMNNSYMDMAKERLWEDRLWD